MQGDKHQSGGGYILSVLVSAAAVIAVFMIQGRLWFDLWDEGFYWYGVQRVLKGEVPIRDFYAYDPGRYYWGAAISWLVRQGGLHGARLAAYAFQFIGLFAGLVMIRRHDRSGGVSSALFLALSAVLICIWMAPYFKSYDLVAPIILIAAFAFLILRPCPARYFAAGAAVGMVAVFGRNHGLYGLAGGLVCLIWINLSAFSISGLRKGVFYSAAGVIAGFSPVIIMLLSVDGFAGVFYDGVLHQLQRESTNLLIPVPMPWDAIPGGVANPEAVRRVLEGLFFLGLPLFAAVTLLWAFYARVKDVSVSPVLAASAFVSLPYIHYAYSRADVQHLAPGGVPVIIGCLAMMAGLSKKTKWPLAIVLLMSSFWVFQGVHPGWQCRKANACVAVDIAGETYRVPGSIAMNLNFISELNRRFAPDGRSIYMAPFWPGAYAYLEKKSPVWDIFPLRPREIDEASEIVRLEAADPGVALIIDIALDGQESLRFRNTHPLIHKYIRDNFRRVPYPPVPVYQVYIPAS